MRLIVLGSAAGGGFPQWNCACDVCRLGWSNDSRVKRRTQSSICVVGDDGKAAIINASPDVREQVGATPALQPTRGKRHSPIVSVLLTNGDIDHVGGLLSLRERHAFTLRATPGIQAILAGFGALRALSEAVVTRVAVDLDEPFALLPGITATLFAVPGKVPLYLEEGEPVTDATTETTVGVVLQRPSGRRIVYVPGCARVHEDLRTHIGGAQVLLFDGTLYSDGEMLKAGVGEKTGRRMGHVPISGPDGSLTAFDDLRLERKVYTHINNTNPILVQGSTQRAQVVAAGWEVAFDGMEIAL